MSLQLVSPPAVEPVTLDEAKLHLKVDTTDDDALIASLIAAARARVEWHTGRALVTQSWVLWLDGWPACACVEIPLPPLQAVGAVTAYARDDTATVLDSDLTQVDLASTPGRLALKDAVVFSDLRAVNAVSIAFTAGYGDGENDVPQVLRTGILQIVAGLYAHRGDDAVVPALPALLAPYRVVNL